MLVVSFSFSGVSFILSFRMNDKRDVIGRFFFFLNADAGFIFNAFLFLPFDAGPHCDENVFLTTLRIYIAMRMFFLAALRARILYPYVSETYE